MLLFVLTHEGAAAGGPLRAPEFVGELWDFSRMSPVPTRSAGLIGLITAASSSAKMATSTLHLGAGGAVSSLAARRLTHFPCQVNHHIAPDTDFFVLSRVGIITAKLSHISVLPPGTYTLTHSVPRHLSRQWKVEEQTSPRHDHLIIHILPIRPSCLSPKGKQIQMPSRPSPLWLSSISRASSNKTHQLFCGV